MRDRIEDERRLRMQRSQQDHMRSFLASQVQEKKAREQHEKRVLDEQAVIWKKDWENHERQEAKLGQKIRNLNRENADFLRKQIEEKQLGRKGMNAREAIIHKQLLEDMRSNRKDSRGASGPLI